MLYVKMKQHPKLKDMRFFLLFLISIILISPIAFCEENDPNILNMPKSTAMLYPLPESVDMGKELKFDLVVYPYLEGLHPDMQKANHYQFEISFDPAVLKLNQVENLVPNMDIKQSGSTATFKMQAFAKNPAGDVYPFKPIRFARFTFVAIGKSESSFVKIDNVYIMNSFGNGGTYAEIVNDYLDGKIAVLEAGLNSFIEESSGSNSGKYWNLSEVQKKKIFEQWAEKNADQKKFYAECKPSCEAKQCGTDGCGGFCVTLDGKCPSGQECINYQCVCQPSCFGKNCGDDGCGGLCMNQECPKSSKLLFASTFSWNKWYSYLLIILILMIIISALLAVKRETLRQKLHEFREKRAQKKAARQAAKLSLQTSLTAKLAAKQAAGQATGQAASRPSVQSAKLTKTSAQPSTQQKPQQPMQSAPSPVPPQLVSYVKQQSAKGITRNQMEQALIRVGWKKEQIDRAFDEVGL